MQRFMQYQELGQRPKSQPKYTTEQIDTWGFYISSAILLGFIVWGRFI